MLTKAELPECPVATTLQLIGNKWKMLILRNLMGRPWGGSTKCCAPFRASVRRC